MRFIDVPNPDRINRTSDRTVTIFEDGNFIQQGFKVNKVTLHLYVEKTDAQLGVYSLITSVVHTDKGSIEMIYDEGFRGHDSLERVASFLSANLGVSSVILRSIIALKELTDT